MLANENVHADDNLCVKTQEIYVASTSSSLDNDFFYFFFFIDLLHSIKLK